MIINDLIEHLEGVRRDLGDEVQVALEYRPWLINDWQGTDDFEIDVSPEELVKGRIVLVWGEGYGFSTECGGDIDMCPKGGCEVCDL